MYIIRVFKVFLLLLFKKNNTGAGIENITSTNLLISIWTLTRIFLQCFMLCSMKNVNYFDSFLVSFAVLRNDLEGNLPPREN